MVIATVTLHGIGLAVLARGTSGERHAEKAHHLAPMSLRAIGFMLMIVLSLFLLHGVEIWAYATLYRWIGAQPHFEAALYFSTISYAAIGYNDASMPHAWRLLGAIEGINGVLLLGWSTAFFVNLLGRLRA